MNRFKVNTKIYLIVMIASFCILAVGIVGYINNKNTMNAMKGMYFDNLKAVQWLSEASIQARTCQSAVFELMLVNVTGRQHKSSRILEDIENFKLNLAQAIKDYSEKTVLDATEVEKFERVKKNIEFYISTLVKVVEMSKSGDTKATYTVYESASAMLDEFQNNLEDLIKYNETLSDSTYSKNLANSNSSIIFLTIAVALALLGASIFGFVIGKSISNPLKETSKFLQNIAQGDFRNDIPKRILSGKDEISDIGRALSLMQENIKKLLYNVLEIVKSVKTSDGKVNEMVSALNNNVDNVNADIEGISNGIKETFKHSQEISGYYDKVQKSVEQIFRYTEDGSSRINIISNDARRLKDESYASQESTNTMYQSVMKKIRDAIQESKEVEKINSLSEAILEISEQTSLLALNASIEAARAGDSGKGFGVVANEIKKLAQQSHNSVSDIQAVTKLVLNSVQNLSQSSEEIISFIEKKVMGDYSAMVNIANQYDVNSDFINNLISSFSTTAKELKSSTEVVSKSIVDVSSHVSNGANEISELTHKTADIVDKVRDIYEIVAMSKEETSALENSVKIFKL